MTTQSQWTCNSRVGNNFSSKSALTNGNRVFCWCSQLDGTQVKGEKACWLKLYAESDIADWLVGNKFVTCWYPKNTHSMIMNLIKIFRFVFPASFPLRFNDSAKRAHGNKINCIGQQSDWVVSFVAEDRNIKIKHTHKKPPRASYSRPRDIRSRFTAEANLCQYTECIDKANDTIKKKSNSIRSFIRQESCNIMCVKIYEYVMWMPWNTKNKSRTYNNRRPVRDNDDGQSLAYNQCPSLRFRSTATECNRCNLIW